MTAAIAAWMAVWWITEPIDLAITSLLPLVLFPLCGVAPLKSISGEYGNEIIFLFMAGFFFGKTIERWQLHRRIALRLVFLLGSNPARTVLGFMLATGFISMWISNTATAVMMTPVAIAVARDAHYQGKNFNKALLLGVGYACSIGGLATFTDGGDRLYNPLPLFHVNASIFSFYCIMLRGNCQVQADRFSPARWWTEVVESRATVVHYLGVVVPMLLVQPPSPLDRGHRVRFAIGAGVDPQRHVEFEQRFGFPLIEIWGMTEMVRAMFDNEPPRQVGTRVFGKPRPGLEVRIVDDQDRDLPDGTPGEMLVRHSADTPRAGFYSGYLDDPVATEQAWRGGWFHTGDIVTRAPSDGLLRFVDRRKNIIRRSGENIAAAEVEAVLQAHPWVEQAAVLAAPDEVREEEVLACVMLSAAGRADPAAAVEALFEHCRHELAYYKAPGWLWITDHIPTTSTQKIQKHQIFEPGIDPRRMPGMIDLRARKKRDAATRS